MPAWQHVNQSIGSNLDSFVPRELSATKTRFRYRFPKLMSRFDTCYGTKMFFYLNQMFSLQFPLYFFCNLALYIFWSSQLNLLVLVLVTVNFKVE